MSYLSQFPRTPEQTANAIARIVAAFPDGVTANNIADMTIRYDQRPDDLGVLSVVIVTTISVEDAVALTNGEPLEEPESDVEDDEAPFLDHTDQVAERMIEDQEAGR